MMTKTRLVYVFALVMVVLALVACAGIDLADFIRVKTPNAIQRTVGLPARTSLNEAQQEYQAWFEGVQRSGAQWKANIERGDEIRGLLGQLTLRALGAFGPELAGVPVLGAALPALTGLVGLFIGAGRLRKEKEASFNKGLKTAGGTQIAGGTPTLP